MYGPQDLNWLSASIERIYAAQTIPELSQAATAAIDIRFSLVASTMEEFGLGVSSYSLHRIRSAVQPPKDFAAYIHDNPLSAFMGGGRCPPAIHLRQLVPFSTWCRTDHYNGVAKPTCFSDQLILVAQTEPSFGTVSLYRDTVFTPDERRLASFLQPHLVAAWCRVRAVDTVGRTGPLRVSLSPALRPLGLSAEVRQVFKAYFDSWRDDDCLPGTVSSWVAHTLSELRLRPQKGPLRALSAESIRGRLLVRCFPDDSGPLIHLVMLEIPATPSFLRLKGAGLTFRQCEVMHWIAQGKRDAEMAQILGLSVKTVGKHVENTLRKLGVVNRTTALNRVYDWLDNEQKRPEK